MVLSLNIESFTGKNHSQNPPFWLDSGLLLDPASLQSIYKGLTSAFTRVTILINLEQRFIFIHPLN